MARFNRDWREGHRIVQKDNTAHLNVGREDWQLPVPMVKETGGWRFDMAAAGNEILTRTIGRNELSTLQAMHLTLMRSRIITYKTIAGRTG